MNAAVDTHEAHVTLDQATHIYRLQIGARSRILPSVTQALSVIESFDHVPPEILEAARRFGTAVHTCIQLYNERDLDEPSLDERIVPRLAGYRKFLLETGFQVYRGEEIVHSAGLGYAGTLDLRGTLFRSPALIDFKSGAIPRTVGPQTAAYREALPDAHWRRRARRYCLQVLDYDYRLIECKDPADFSNFLSALNVYRFQRRENPYAECCAA